MPIVRVKGTRVTIESFSALGQVGHGQGNGTVQECKKHCRHCGLEDRSGLKSKQLCADGEYKHCQWGAWLVRVEWDSRKGLPEWIRGSHLIQAKEVEAAPIGQLLLPF